LWHALPAAIDDPGGASAPAARSLTEVRGLTEGEPDLHLSGMSALVIRRDTQPS
jgi:hypothetical protein